jgi:hypothetical protein
MKFYFTKRVAVLSFFSFILWISLTLFSPRERYCEVKYYGNPDLSHLSGNILNSQLSSYDMDYNYYRALNGTDCIASNGEFFCKLSKNIFYYGNKVREGTINKYIAQYEIAYQVKKIYKLYGLSELQVKLIPQQMNPIFSDTVIENEAFQYLVNKFDNSYDTNCTTTMNVTNNLNYNIGDTIPCYVYGYNYYCNGQSCDIYLEKHFDFDGFSNFLRYVMRCSTMFVFSIVMIATFCRFYKFCRKNKNIKFYNENSEEMNNDSDEDEDNNSDEDEDEDNNSDSDSDEDNEDNDQSNLPNNIHISRSRSTSSEQIQQRLVDYD